MYGLKDDISQMHVYKRALTPVQENHSRQQLGDSPYTLEEYKSHPSFKDNFLKHNEIEGKHGLSTSAIADKFMGGQKMRATTLRGTGRRSFITFSTLIDNDQFSLDQKFLQSLKIEKSNSAEDKFSSENKKINSNLRQNVENLIKMKKMPKNSVKNLQPYETTI